MWLPASLNFEKKKAIVLYPLSEQVPGAAWNKQSAGSGSDALGWDGAWEVYSGTVPSAPLPAALRDTRQSRAQLVCLWITLWDTRA